MIEWIHYLHRLYEDKYGGYSKYRKRKKETTPHYTTSYHDYNKYIVIVSYNLLLWLWLIMCLCGFSFHFISTFYITQLKVKEVTHKTEKENKNQAKAKKWFDKQDFCFDSDYGCRVLMNKHRSEKEALCQKKIICYLYGREMKKFLLHDSFECKS